MAADLTQTFQGKHFEKIVLGAAVAVFLAALVFFVVQREGRDAFLRADVVRAVSQVTQPTEPPTLGNIITGPQRTALGLDAVPLTSADYDRQLTAHAPAVKMPGPITQPYLVAGTVIKPPSDKNPRPPEKIVPVIDIEVADGRGLTNDALPTAVEKTEGKPSYYDIVWAAVVGRVDLTEQLNAILKADAEPQEILFTRVELRRRERKPDGSWTDWQPVASTVPPALQAKMPRMPSNPQDKRAVGEWYLSLKAMQQEVRRTPLWPLVGVDPQGKTVVDMAGPITGVEQPPMPSPQAEESQTAAAPAPAPAVAAAPVPPTPSGSPGTPAWLENLPGPGKTPTPGTGPAAPTKVQHVYGTVWATDYAVVPGRTYQYQVRVGLFNPVYSRPLVKEDADRWALEYLSPWSQASKEVAVPPLAQFYFVGVFGGAAGEKANLELHRWIHGQWVTQTSVPRPLGSPILYSKRVSLNVPGGRTAITRDVDMSPGAFLVDVLRDFMYLPPGEGNKQIRTNILVFSDGQNRVEKRIEWVDRQEAIRDRQGRQEAVAPPPTRTETRPTKTPDRRPATR